MAFPKDLIGTGAPTNGVNAVHTLTTSGSPTTGVLYLKIRGRVVGPIDPDADSTDVAAALTAVFPSGISVQGTDLAGGLTLIYSGTSMSRQPQPLPTIDANTWNTGTITIVSATTGVLPTGERGLPIGSTYLDTATGLVYENISSTVNPRWVLAASDGAVPVVALTTGATLTEVQSGSIVTNTGAVGVVTAVLPTATVGLSFIFSLGAAQELRIDPAGSETVSLPSTGVPGAAGKYLSADAIGETVHLVCATGGNWAIAGYTGTWTAES